MQDLAPIRGLVGGRPHEHAEFERVVADRDSLLQGARHFGAERIIRAQPCTIGGALLAQLAARQSFAVELVQPEVGAPQPREAWNQ
ncbi:MAG TPA: hypothetical protein VLJ62_29615 [Burkholderiaceae bacterium]|nr:hypothetical protein [Burkholderiaceae bacterium]